MAVFVSTCELRLLFKHCMMNKIKALNKKVTTSIPIGPTRGITFQISSVFNSEFFTLVLIVLQGIP